MASVSEPLTPPTYHQTHWAESRSASCPVATADGSGKNIDTAARAAQNVDRGTARPAGVECILPHASAEANVVTPPKAPSPVAVWEMQLDPASGRKFYLCRETQESSWRTPCGVNVKILPPRPPHHFPLQSLSQQQPGPQQQSTQQQSTKQLQPRRQRPEEKDKDKQQTQQKQQHQASTKRKAQKRLRQQQTSNVSSNSACALKRARSCSHSLPTMAVSAQPKARGSVAGGTAAASAPLSPPEAGENLRVVQARRRRQLRLEHLRKRRNHKRKHVPAVERDAPAEPSAALLVTPTSVVARTCAAGRALEPAVAPMPMPTRALVHAPGGACAAPAWHAQLMEEAATILGRDVAPRDANFLVGSHDKPYAESLCGSASRREVGDSIAATASCEEYSFLAASQQGTNVRGCFASVLPGTHLDVSWGGDYDYNDSEITTKPADLHRTHHLGEVDMLLNL